MIERPSRGSQINLKNWETRGERETNSFTCGPSKLIYINLCDNLGEKTGGSEGHDHNRPCM